MGSAFSPGERCDCCTGNPADSGSFSDEGRSCLGVDSFWRAEIRRVASRASRTRCINLAACRPTSDGTLPYRARPDRERKAPARELMLPNFQRVGFSFRSDKKGPCPPWFSSRRTHEQKQRKTDAGHISNETNLRSRRTGRLIHQFLNVTSVSDPCGM